MFMESGGSLDLSVELKLAKRTCTVLCAKS